MVSQTQILIFLTYQNPLASMTSKRFCRIFSKWVWLPWSSWSKKVIVRFVLLVKSSIVWQEFLYIISFIKIFQNWEGFQTKKLSQLQKDKLCWSVNIFNLMASQQFSNSKFDKDFRVKIHLSPEKVKYCHHRLLLDLWVSYSRPASLLMKTEQFTLRPAGLEIIQSWLQEADLRF